MAFRDIIFAMSVLMFAGAAIAAADLKPEFFYSDDMLLGIGPYTVAGGNTLDLTARASGFSGRVTSRL